MPFVLPYSAVSEEALIDNILLLFTTNFKAALDALYPTLNLPDFAERSLGMVLGNEPPCLGIGPIRNVSTKSDDAAHLAEGLMVGIAMAVVDDNAQTVTRRIMRYMRAGEAVLRAGNKNDFFGMVNTARTFGFSLDCEHIYTQDIRSNGSIYFRDATLQATVTIREGQ